MTKHKGVRYSWFAIGLYSLGLIITTLVLFAITYAGSISIARQESMHTADKENALIRLVFEQHFQQLEYRLRRTAADKDLASALLDGNLPDALYLLERLNTESASSLIDVIIVEAEDQRAWLDASLLPGATKAFDLKRRETLAPDVWQTIQVSDEQGGDVYRALSLRITHPQTHRPIGRLFAAVKLNDSYFLMGAIARVLNTENLQLFYRSEPIASLGEQDKLNRLSGLATELRQSGHVLDDGLLALGTTLDEYEKEQPLLFTAIHPSEALSNVQETYRNLFGPFLLYAVLAAVVASLLLKRVTSPALQKLMAYARFMSRSKHITGYQPGQILEFNVLADMFKEAFESVRDTDAQFRELIDGSLQGVLVHADQRILYANDALLKILGHDPAEKEDLIGGATMSIYAPSERERMLSYYNPRTNGGLAPRVYEVKGARSDGSEVWLEQHVRMTSWDGKEAFYATITDITERKRQEALIVQHAHYDALTGLPNRTLFMDRLAQETKRAMDRGDLCAVLYIDLDRFKTINESHGHTYGDRLIQIAAERIKSALPQGQTMARLSGDEFAVILTEIQDEWSVESVASAILKNLANVVTMDNADDFYVTGSIGIAVSPSDGNSIEALLRHVDMAMYQAKSEGGNTFSFFSKRLDRKTNRAIKLETALRRAIAEETIELHFQPIHDFQTGSIASCEVLARWSHPELGRVPPDEFIPIAEESGLIVPLGIWILRRSCQTFQSLQRSGFTLPKISVNISPRQCREAGFADTVAYILDETGMTPDCLQLEITESVMFDNRRIDPAEVLTDLKNLGIHLSLDDFGTGFSSLSYLKQLPIDTLKIDRSFIKDIENDADDRALVSAIISMASSLDIQVVSEGAENAAQCEILTKMGCRLIQGYHISRPMAEADFRSYLRADVASEHAQAVVQAG
ncbi:PAS domain S-box-containing protein/diguanylate cyclase (GGDEF)-like protein [Roseibium hamelinense]|uniref:PAS domain S-box-containing protein/diguanylate cyclase (GGDEF)-like protein n=1 Tax=Roseibium hamelinense TaxID=150831 RepID=A0A562T1U7_9HYPH|nr:EAL domain-containing protein [Roseibium hamelinense]MTI44655.1 EAL domain-containing protein [Roseibium hamelinense]TWI87283.1 PAS domain S-box-containing protein/diguanylate cyclase (GGDEF)-like protein [Roseibium hamelinense]